MDVYLSPCIIWFWFDLGKHTCWNINKVVIWIVKSKLNLTYIKLVRIYISSCIEVDILQIDILFYSTYIVWMLNMDMQNIENIKN